MEYTIRYVGHPDLIDRATDCAVFVPLCDIDGFKFWFLDSGMCLYHSFPEIISEPGYMEAFTQALALYSKYYQVCFMAQVAKSLNVADGDLLEGLKRSRISRDECFDNYERCKWMLTDDTFGNIPKQRSMVEALYQYSHPDPGYVYLVQSVTGHYKIGKTRNPEDRLRTFNVKLPFEVDMLHTIKCRDYTSAESELHRRFAAKRVNGEWFALSPDDVTAIRSIERL